MGEQSSTESVEAALSEAQFYIQGLRLALPNEPGLPRFAVGFNGTELRVSVLANDGKWRPIVHNGAELKNAFLDPETLMLGVNAQGQLSLRKDLRQPTTSGTYFPIFARCTERFPN